MSRFYLFSLKLIQVSYCCRYRVRLRRRDQEQLTAHPNLGRVTNDKRSTGCDTRSGSEGVNVCKGTVH